VTDRAVLLRFWRDGFAAGAVATRESARRAAFDEVARERAASAERRHDLMLRDLNTAISVLARAMLGENIPEVTDG
jgi:hypothetical protein